MTRLKVLIVDDEPAILTTLQRIMEFQKFDCVLANNGVEALDLLDEHRFDLIITDIRMPKMDGIALVKKVREKYQFLLIIMMSGHGDENTVISAMRAGANNFFRKPFTDITELQGILQPHFMMAEERRRQEFNHRQMKALNCQIEIESNFNHIPSVVYYLLEQLLPQHLYPPLSSLVLILYEVLTNAIEHGNLEITGLDKKQALKEERYEELKEERLQQETFRSRHVQLEMDFNPSRIKIVVIDEGPGFDWRQLQDPTETETLLMEHGRGLYLAKTICDEVIFNEKGNQITLTVNLSKP